VTQVNEASMIVGRRAVAFARQEQSETGSAAALSGAMSGGSIVVLLWKSDKRHVPAASQMRVRARAWLPPRPHRQLDAILATSP
jgi:surface antigen